MVSVEKLRAKFSIADSVKKKSNTALLKTSKQNSAVLNISNYSQQHWVFFSSQKI